MSEQQSDSDVIIPVFQQTLSYLPVHWDLSLYASFYVVQAVLTTEDLSAFCLFYDHLQGGNYLFVFAEFATSTELWDWEVFSPCLSP